jgi:hypothetical protein
MPEERKKLPSLIVPPDGYTLMDNFARANRLSLSEAIRQLLQESPRLIDFAAQEGADLGEVLSVKSWGGQPRERGGDD